jgi:hypothetical protein
VVADRADRQAAGRGQVGGAKRLVEQAQQRRAVRADRAADVSRTRERLAR